MFNLIFIYHHFFIIEWIKTYIPTYKHAVQIYSTRLFRSGVKNSSTPHLDVWIGRLTAIITNCECACDPRENEYLCIAFIQTYKASNIQLCLKSKWIYVHRIIICMRLLLRSWSIPMGYVLVRGVMFGREAEILNLRADK